MNEWQQSGSPQVLGRLNNARARKAIHHEGKSFSPIVTITMIAFSPMHKFVDIALRLHSLSEA